MTSADEPLRSDTHDADGVFEANELFQSNGWTDGLPIVPPTEPRVREFLEAAGARPGEVIATEPVRRRQITAEKVAINAIMAGCLPEYLPVVIAAVEAISQEEFCLHGSAASTGGSAHLIVVNGSIRNQLGMNATHNVFGNGNRANATIGRAVRLIVMNVLGGIPGTLDQSTLGHAGKFTFCIAEDEDDSPWKPLAAERGMADRASAVTVLASLAPRQVMNEWSDAPEEILETFAAEIRASMLSYSIWPGNFAIIVPKQLRDLIAAAGWQKREVREYIYRSARVTRSDWRKVGKGRLAIA